MKSIEDLTNIATESRISLMNVVKRAGGGHVGGSLSATDILTVLYFHVMRYSSREQLPNRDRFIMSKGHSVESLYAILAKAGFFPEEELEQYGSYQSRLFAHPTMKTPGVEVPSGALGHGLSIGVGMALAAHRDRRDSNVYVLMGDGEQAEGSVWEAAMSASHYELGNLIGIIDYNKLQISGRVDDVMRLSPLKERWESFGWCVREVDGNDIEALVSVFDSIDSKCTQPTLILAHTIKGKGVSFMENNPIWHHRVPTDEEFQIAINDLEGDLRKAQT